jgi:hypothetical protein
MNWTLKGFLEAMQKMMRKPVEVPQVEPGALPEDPFAYAGVRNRPRRPPQSGAVAVELEP